MAVLIVVLVMISMPLVSRQVVAVLEGFCLEMVMIRILGSIGVGPPYDRRSVVLTGIGLRPKSVLLTLLFCHY